MGEENILPSEDGKDKEEPPGKHEEHQNRKEDGEEERKGGMDVLQSHHRDIPEQKDEKEEDQTGENQKSDEDSLLGFNLQSFLQKDVTRDSWFVNRVRKTYFKK
jgi:hypothetical protein